MIVMCCSSLNKIIIRKSTLTYPHIHIYINRSEGEVLSHSRVPKINLEGMVMLENHKLATIIVIDAGKGQQRMLKLVG